MAGCGTTVGFEIADQDRGKKKPEVPDTLVADPVPLVLVSEADPRASNKVLGANVKRVEGAFDFKPEQATKISLWITQFKPMKCGGMEAVRPEFYWAELLADGSLGDSTQVDPQENFVIAAGVAHRLTVKMKTSGKQCESLLLKFEAHAKGL